MLYNKLVKAPNLYKFKNMYTIKHSKIHHSKIHNNLECYYCNGSGWIAWKSNNNPNNILDLSKQPNIILYTVCPKCQ